MIKSVISVCAITADTMKIFVFLLVVILVLLDGHQAVLHYGKLSHGRFKRFLQRYPCFNFTPPQDLNLKQILQLIATVRGKWHVAGWITNVGDAFHHDSCEVVELQPRSDDVMELSIITGNSENSGQLELEMEQPGVWVHTESETRMTVVEIQPGSFLVLDSCRQMYGQEFEFTTVLSRASSLPSATVKQVFRELQSKGLDISASHLVDRDNC